MSLRRYLRRQVAEVGKQEWLNWPYHLDPQGIRVERVSVTVPNLPLHLEGFAIGVLSDLHVGPLVRPNQARRAAQMLADLQPDLVLLAGDLVSDVEAVKEMGYVLAPLRGAFAVLGNWDYGSESAFALCFRPAFRMLVNEGVEPVPGLWLAGLDDVLLGKPDLEAALAGAPIGAVRILLVHEPDFADRVRPEHQIALQISGHTHGGQIRAPLIGPLLLPTLGRKYHTGLRQAPACQVYTTRGLGVTHIPIRFLCPPEITLLTLTSTPHQTAT